MTEDTRVRANEISTELNKLKKQLDTILTLVPFNTVRIGANGFSGDPVPISGEIKDVVLQLVKARLQSNIARLEVEFDAL